MSLVTFDELREMSGKETPEDVGQWLKDRRIPYVVACDNKPMTLTEWFARKDENPEPVTVGMVYNTKGEKFAVQEKDGELVVVPAEDAT